MPHVPTLDEYMRRSGAWARCAKEGQPLAGLRGAVVAIDGGHWFHSRYEPADDPFRCQVAGVPGPLVVSLLRDIDGFSEAGIKPFVVFNGLNVPAPLLQPHHHSEKIHNNKYFMAWEAQRKGDNKAAISFLQKNFKYALSQNVLQGLLCLLTKKKVEWIRAPFLALAQLAWITSATPPSATHIWASPECFMFPQTTSIILDINFQNHTYTTLDQSTLFHELLVTQEQFTDACPITTYVEQVYPQYPKRRNFGDTLNFVKSTPNIMQALRSRTPESAAVLRTARSMIQHHMIFNYSCVCEPISGNPPANIDGIFGPRLPDQAFFFICMGVISPQVLNNIISATLVETSPLVDSTEYRGMLSDLVDVRANTFSTVCATMNPVFRSRSILWQHYWEDTNPQDLQIRAGPELSSIKLLANDEEIEVELKRQGTTHVDMCFVLSTRAQHSLPGTNQSIPLNSPLPERGPEPFRSTKSYLSSALLHSLISMENISPEGSLTPLGDVLNEVLLKKGGHMFQEQCLIALELLRAGYLTSMPLNYIPPSDTDNTSNHARLSSRVFSLLPAQLEPKPWNQVDHDLAGFHSVVTALWRSLRNLHEIVALTLFLQYQVELPPQAYREFSSQLPFFQQPGTELGIVCKHIMEDTSDNITLESLLATFPAFGTTQQIAQQLNDGWLFWCSVMSIAETLAKNGVLTPQQWTDFEQTNTVLFSKWSSIPGLQAE